MPTLRKIVLDLETKSAAVRGNIAALGVSVVGVYDYTTDKYRAYEEKEIVELEELLQQTEEIIGFNHISFDMPVLKPYLKSIVTDSFKHTDIMLELQKMIGHRVSLDRVASGTLGVKKSGHGLQAVAWYKQGDIESIKKYCLDDVKITKEVYDFGLKNNFLKFRGGWGIYEVPVKFT
jgi:uncharacterized protein YprB with RNaseH-like and TPR domain